MIDSGPVAWHRAAGLRRGLWGILVAGTAGGCCARPHWYEVFGERINTVRPLPKKYADRKLKSGYLDDFTCAELCGAAVEDCHLAHTHYPGIKAPQVAVCHYEGSERCWNPVGNMPAGRRPAGLADTPGAARLLAWARLEAASVIAFERLAAELSREGAPTSLVKRAERAAQDERRHARAVAALAGVPVPEVVVAEGPPRSLMAIALENAVEGCVRETFGALVGWHQARYAEAATTRQVFARIAADETAHGALAWAIHRWALPHLTVEERTEVQAAMAIAAQACQGAPPDDAEGRALGLPTPPTWRALAQAFAGELAVRPSI